MSPLIVGAVCFVIGIFAGFVGAALLSANGDDEQ